MFWFIGKSKKKLNRQFLNLSDGFSLLEMIVVIAIFLIITAVVIVDIPNFRGKSTLDLTVGEVATYIRGAQVYSSAQLGFEPGSQPSYYISFTKNSSDFFMSKEGETEAAENYSLNGFLISNFLLRKVNTYNCSINNIDINFKTNSYIQNIGTILEASMKIDNGEDIIEDFEYLDLQIRGIRNQNLVGCLRVYRNGQVTNISCDSDDSFDQCSS